MGWYKVQCPHCWDNHDGRTCEEFQAERARWRAIDEHNRLMREQTEQLRRIARRLERRPTKGRR